jgi:hypothetical protein
MFLPRPFTDYTTRDFGKLVSTNLDGFIHLSQLAVIQMLPISTGSGTNKQDMIDSKDQSILRKMSK